MQALDLRVSAINGLNRALSRPCHTAAEADARYAAAIALTFQSSYMPDGMMDFLAMMRGWMLIQTTLVMDQTKSMFCAFTRESFVGSMEEHIEHRDRPGDDTAIQDCLASLKTIEPLCQSNSERQYLAMLMRLAKLSIVSPRQGESLHSLQVLFPDQHRQRFLRWSPATPGQTR